MLWRKSTTKRNYQMCSRWIWWNLWMSEVLNNVNLIEVETCNGKFLAKKQTHVNRGQRNQVPQIHIFITVPRNSGLIFQMHFVKEKRFITSSSILFSTVIRQKSDSKMGVSRKQNTLNIRKSKQTNNVCVRIRG